MTLASQPQHPINFEQGQFNFDADGNDADYHSSYPEANSNGFGDDFSLMVERWDRWNILRSLRLLLLKFFF